MIVLSQRDVFNSCVVALQVALHVFKEPGFKVQADSVDLMSERKREEVKCDITCENKSFTRS